MQIAKYRDTSLIFPPDQARNMGCVPISPCNGYISPSHGKVKGQVKLELRIQKSEFSSR